MVINATKTAGGVLKDIALIVGRLLIWTIDGNCWKKSEGGWKT